MSGFVIDKIIKVSHSFKQSNKVNCPELSDFELKVYSNRSKNYHESRMMDWSSLITSAVAVTSVIIGSSLQYFLSRDAEARKHERTLRLQSYAEYMRSVGEAEMLKTTIDHDRRNTILAVAIASKAKVCIHGSATAIAALERFEGKDRGEGLTPEKKQYFAQFVNEIRKEAKADGGVVNEKVINSILFTK